MRAADGRQFRAMVRGAEVLTSVAEFGHLWVGRPQQTQSVRQREGITS